MRPALLLAVALGAACGDDLAPETIEDACLEVADRLCDAAFECGTLHLESSIPDCVEFVSRSCGFGDDPRLRWSECRDYTFTCDELRDGSYGEGVCFPPAES